MQTTLKICVSETVLMGQGQFRRVPELFFKLISVEWLFVEKEYFLTENNFGGAPSGLALSFKQALV